MIDKEKFLQIARKKTEKETRQAMQGFVHNMNSLHSRAADQIPFSSVNLGLDTSDSGRLVTRHLILQMLHGGGDKETFIYPIVIFHVLEGINFYPEDPNYDLYRLAMQSSSERIYPNYNFADSPFQFQYLRNKQGKLLWKAKEKFYIETGDLVLEEQEGLSTLDRIRAMQRVERCRRENGKTIFDVQSWVNGSDLDAMVAEAHRLGAEQPVQIDSLQVGLDDRTVAARMGCLAYYETVSAVVDGVYLGDIKIGELVENYDLGRNQVYVEDVGGVVTRVKRFIHNKNDVDWLRITFDESGKYRDIVVTVDHPFMLEDDKVVRADELKNYGYVLNKNKDKVKIDDIEKWDIVADSYDVETTSGTFVFSNIYSHNCRTLTISDALAEYGPEVDAPDKYIYDRGAIPPYGYTLGRGNFNFVTLNLPRLAIESVAKYKGKKYFVKRDEKEQQRIVSYFHQSVLKYMLYAKNVLQLKQKIIGNKPKINFFFHLEQDLIRGSQELKENDKTYDIWEHFSKSIGYIGLYETMLLLYGKDQVEDGEHALEIIQFMRKVTDCLSEGYYVLPTKEGMKLEKWYEDMFNVDESRFSKRTPVKSDWDIAFQVYDINDNPIFLKDYAKLTKGNWSLFATPAEGACMAFRNADYKDYGPIKNVTDKEYYTNSNHVDVRKCINMKNKIKVEAPYHTLANAGNIFYLETDGAISKNIDAYEEILRNMHDAELGYCGVNVPLDYCCICRHHGEIPEDEGCPVCGNKDEDNIIRIARVTGYITAPNKVVNTKTNKATMNQGLNAGKKAEVASRVKHK